MTYPPRFGVRAATHGDLGVIRRLFTDYTNSLGIDLSFQNFANELASLPGLYSPPTGALLLALSSDNEPIGCVALRPLKSVHGPPGSDRKICEMKRLYCLPAARGLGVGRALAEKVIKEATILGYQEVRLDTLPQMVGARKLYQMLGFEEIEPYYDTPLKGTIFLGKKLGVS